MFFFAVLYQTLSKEKSLKPLKFQGFLKYQRLENWGARRAAFRPYFLRSLAKSPLFSMGISHASKNAPQNEPYFGLEAKAAVTLEIKSLG